MKAFYAVDAAQNMGQVITTFFVAASKEVKSRRDGEPYLDLILADRTGLIRAKLWDHIGEFAACFQRDDFVKVRGRVTSYSGRYELTLERIRRAEDAEVEPSDYLPRTDKNTEELWTALEQFIGSVGDLELKTLLQTFLADEEIAELLRLAPAGKTMHHAYLGGLLEHVVSLCGLADVVCHHYAWLNRDLIVAGVLLHDIGKVYELAYSRSFSYTDRGQLVGHIAIALQMLHQKVLLVPQLTDDLLTLLQHLILSHHGTKEQGSPVEPAFAEALALHFIDNLDAKLQAASIAMRSNGSGSPWTARVQNLGQPMLDVQKFLLRTRAATPHMSDQSNPIDRTSSDHGSPR